MSEGRDRRPRHFRVTYIQSFAEVAVRDPLIAALTILRRRSPLSRIGVRENPV